MRLPNVNDLSVTRKEIVSDRVLFEFLFSRNSPVNLNESKEWPIGISAR